MTADLFTVAKINFVTTTARGRAHRLTEPARGAPLTAAPVPVGIQRSVTTAAQ
jgi:hypothetical protein